MLALLGIGLLLEIVGQPPNWLRTIGGGVAAISLLAVAMLAWHLRTPRLAYQDGHLLIWLRSGKPFRVPVDVVECFWLGHAPSLLPGKHHENTKTAALVIRIAHRASPWRQQLVKPQLGNWCDGYVTIRGTWCEPLSLDVVNRLNQRLSEVTRAPAK
jgi:hypothetical protein